MERISVWSLKKKPLREVAAYILHNSSSDFQAGLAQMPYFQYRALSEEQASDSLIQAISRMDDETYTEYLLEIIDE